MKTAALKEIAQEGHEALTAAERLRDRLLKGDAPHDLIPELQQQLESIRGLQQSIRRLAASDVPVQSAEAGTLRETLCRLSEMADDSYRLAQRRGVKVAGLGGKPHGPGS